MTHSLTEFIKSKCTRPSGIKWDELDDAIVYWINLKIHRIQKELDPANHDIPILSWDSYIQVYNLIKTELGQDEAPKEIQQKMV